MKKNDIIKIIIVLLALGATYYLLDLNKESKKITSFEECVEAGYAVMESYPRQCRGGDQTFVEVTEDTLPLIDNETLPPIVGDEGIVCTADAMICPDGTGVGRTGPNCEFAPCPGN